MLILIFLKCLICGVNVNNLCAERIDAIYLDNASHRAFVRPLTWETTS